MAGNMTEKEVFDRDVLESRMSTGWAGRSVLFFEELESTNIQAGLAAEGGAGEGTLVVADSQTAGRGRRGRAWNSPAGVNVYFTLILKPSYEPGRASMVTLVMALAVSEAICETCGLRAEIKWPNDVIVNGRKVCGILTEMNVQEGRIRYVIIGVGVNVGDQNFPAELAATATSLQRECGQRLPRAVLIANIMAAFEKYYEAFRQRGDLSCILEKYNRCLVNMGKEVRVLDPKGEFQGIARGIRKNGELLVELADGSVTEVYAGEVSVRGIYGYV